MVLKELFLKVPPDENDGPTYPGLVLSVHCAIKGVQMGALLGSVAGTLVSWRRKTSLVATVPAFAGGGALIGSALITAMMVGKLSSLPPDEVEYGVKDRGYRLYFHESQTQVDKMTVAGAGIGVLAGMAFLPKAPLSGTMALGAMGGMAAYSIGKTTGIITFGEKPKAAVKAEKV